MSVRSGLVTGLSYSPIIMVFMIGGSGLIIGTSWYYLITGSVIGEPGFNISNILLGLTVGTVLFTSLVSFMVGVEVGERKNT